MHIAFFGSSLTSAYWNGAATYYRGIIRALHARGFRITFYEPDAYDRQAHRDIPDPEWARVVVYSADRESNLDPLLAEARKADVVVKTSGIGVFDAFLEAAIPAAARPDAVTVFWDVDAPATLDRIDQNPADPFRSLIPKYDMVLTYGGGDPVVRGYRKHRAQSCVPIYNALDPATHYPVEPAAGSRSARTRLLFWSGRNAAGPQISVWRQRLGGRDNAAKRYIHRPCFHRRSQCIQLHATSDFECQPRQHGPLWILTSDTRV